MTNKLYFGDNLDVMREKVKDESVDLVYLDPPFNSNATYNVLFKEQGRIASEAQAEAFRDTWGWGEAAAIAFHEASRSSGDLNLLMHSFRSWLGDNAMMAYLAMMAIRLVELHRTLKPNGSLYLHCDPTASHYLKLLLDAIFGHEFYRNEIIWKRTGAHGRAKRWGPVHDTILFYTRSDKYTWNRTFETVDEEYLETRYNFKDSQGSYQPISLTGPGTRTGSSGRAWRNVDPTDSGRHWELPPDRALPKFFKFPNGYAQMDCQERLDVLDAAGLIYWPPRGKQPRFKRYAEVAGGNSIQDVITDIAAVNSQAQERIGYPTQKPMALLQRIIGASSNRDDVILDPFCGCGTSVEASQDLDRQWLGIDVTHYAITLIERRLRKVHPDAQYSVVGRPTDLAGAIDLARRDKHQFQWWAAWLLGAQTYESKKGADRGIDGNIYFANGPYGLGRIIISVKGGDHVSPVMVRELSGVVKREDATMGILVTLIEPTKSMVADAVGAGFVEKSAHGRLPRIQIITIGELLDGRRPKMPPLPEPDRQQRPRGKSAKERDQLELLLPLVGGSPTTEKGEILDPRYMKIG